MSRPGPVTQLTTFDQCTTTVRLKVLQNVEVQLLTCQAEIRAVKLCHKSLTMIKLSRTQLLCKASSRAGHR